MLADALLPTASWDEPERALDAPFVLPADWDPIPGTCSRCGQRAALGETRWWHLGPACRVRPQDRLTRPVAAEFIPNLAKEQRC